MYIENKIKRYFKAGIKLCVQLIFPLRCPVCDDIVRPFGEKICLRCMKRLKLLTPPWCLQCGKKLWRERELCGDCRRIKHNFIRGRALYEYHSAASAIYRFKYSGRREYAEYFGEAVAAFLGDFICSVKPDALVPVPLHRKRERKRGYNQAKLLADEIGRRMDIPVYGKLLVRVKNTVPLKRQNPKERQNNLKKAFNVAQNDVKLNTVIVVDDIYTTGSTIDEVSTVLKEHGVRNVYFVTLACGEGI